MERPDAVWHPEVIADAARDALSELRGQAVLERFYLAGGTGLALRLGHRRSVDLDFFSVEPFDQDALLDKLQHASEFALLAKDTQTLHAQIRGARVSFLGYSYPLLFPVGAYLGVRVADSQDIACMKISAIAGRGARRDFIDLYAVSRQHGLAALLDLFRQKFAQANYSMVHVLKSLAYFEEAEKDPMPDMLAAVSWEDLKEFFRFEAARLL